MDDRYFLYKLSNISGVGAKTANVILERMKAQNRGLGEVFALAEQDFYDMFPDLKVSRDAFSDVDDAQIEREYNELQAGGIDVVTLLDEGYPQSVVQKFGGAAPPILFCRGRVSLLNSDSVAVVGSRDAAADVLEITQAIARSLAASGKNVVSGYAKGVDTSAHLGALAGGGTTTAVLSCGVRQIRPKQELQGEHDLENGLLWLSQFKPNEPWSGRNAMIRNKLVCGLSRAVVVVQAGPEQDENGRMSGTFDAAKTALKFNLPVLVLSPKFFAAAPRGNVQLIQKGATEITDYAEVAELVNSAKAIGNVQANLPLI